MTNRRGRTVAVLQARSSSSRLPGKVLRDLAGAPMILQQLRRLERAQHLDDIVIATSTAVSDDGLSHLLEESGYRVARGSLDDVLGRFIRVMEEMQPDVIVRLTADCPLISPGVVDQVVQHFHESRVDYVSNTMMPTYPDGLDAEVFTSAALKTVHSMNLDHHEREHVTLGIYRRPEVFSIENHVDPSGADHSNLRWTVDTEDDFVFVEQVYRRLLPEIPEFEYSDVLDLVAGDSSLRRTSADVKRNAALDGLDTGAMWHDSQGGPR